MSSLRRAGFSLVELLTVIGIMGGLVLLLLPAVQAARESARASVCQNKLKQISLALNNFESTQRAYPVGANGDGSFRHSWWVGVLPFLEEHHLHEQLDVKSANSGWVIFNPGNAATLDGYVIDTMHCPSSPVPPLRDMFTITMQMPSYVGIAGASDYDGFPEERISICCSFMDGQVSAGGVLFPNDQVRERDISSGDGLSKTIVVGESSTYAYDSKGNERRIDAGYPNGWILGTYGTGTPPDYSGGIVWNVTTIRYGVNTLEYNQPGIHEHYGPNNPLASPHPGGAYAALADGAVVFLPEETDVEILKRLATRDDGRQIPEF